MRYRPDMASQDRIWNFEDAAARFEEMTALAFEEGPQFFAGPQGDRYVLLPKTEYDKMVADYEARR